MHYSVVGILGAGLMGAGIGQVTLDKGMKTILKDMNDAGIARGLAQIQTGIDAKVKRKKISRVEGERLVSGIVATTNYDQFSKCDIVIEAVFEDLGLKHRVVKEVSSMFCLLDSCSVTRSCEIPPLWPIYLWHYV